MSTTTAKNSREHTNGAWGRAALGLKLYMLSPFIWAGLYTAMNLSTGVAVGSTADAVLLILGSATLPAVGPILFAMSPLPRKQKTLARMTAATFIAAGAALAGGLLSAAFSSSAVGMLASIGVAIGFGVWILPLLGWVFMSFALGQTAQSLRVQGVKRDLSLCARATFGFVVSGIAAIVFALIGGSTVVVMAGGASLVFLIAAGALHLSAASKVHYDLTMRQMDEDLAVDHGTQGLVPQS